MGEHVNGETVGLLGGRGVGVGVLVAVGATVGATVAVKVLVQEPVLPAVSVTVPVKVAVAGASQVQAREVPEARVQGEGDKVPPLAVRAAEEVSLIETVAVTLVPIIWGLVGLKEMVQVGGVVSISQPAEIGVDKNKE